VARGPTVQVPDRSPADHPDRSNDSSSPSSPKLTVLPGVIRGVSRTTELSCTLNKDIRETRIPRLRVSVEVPASLGAKGVLIRAIKKNTRQRNIRC